MEKIQRCMACDKDKKHTDFYMSYNPLHKTGRVPICKECVWEIIGDGKLENIKEALRVMDKPYIAHLWESSSKDDNPFGRYMKSVAMKQYRDLTWVDSIFGDERATAEKVQKEKDNKKTKPKRLDRNISQERIEELEEIWGYGHAPQELEYFERKYKSLIGNYPVNTSLHEEALRTYCVYKVKAELETANGNVKDAKTWGEMAQKQGEIAKLNLNKLTKNDLSQGVNSFSEVARLVEKEVEIIPILPRFIEKPNDKLDVAILSFINYERRTRGLDDAEYNDIYEFYQDNLKQYIEDDTKSPEIKKKIIEIEIETERGNKKKILFYDVYAVIEERKKEHPENQFIQNLDKWMELVSYFRWCPDAFYHLLESEEGGGVRLDADQKFVLRCLARFKQNYIVFPRGNAKTAPYVAKVA